MLFTIFENKVGTSLYTACAAARFSIPVEDVTSEQVLRMRAEASSHFYGQHDSGWPDYLLPLHDALNHMRDDLRASSTPVRRFGDIPYAPCCICGEFTDETAFVLGVAHRRCYFSHKPTTEQVEAFYAKYPDRDFREQ